MGGILLSGISDISRRSHLASQSGEGSRERDSTQATSGGKDTCPHVTSLLASGDPWAADQHCLCFTRWSLGRKQQSGGSSTLSPDEGEDAR